MRYEIRPISDRTGFGGRREASLFTASWNDTLLVLNRELTALNASDVIFEVDVTESAIRLDGMLRSDAKASTPCVRLAFESKHGPLSYATDRYVRLMGSRSRMDDWQHNVRAIALGLEALRKVDRYGITKSGEQYTGWKQLPAGRGVAPSDMTKESAREFLLSLMADPEHARHMLGIGSLLRHARAKAHPDRHHGDRTLWDKVEQAGDVLGLT